MVFAGLFYVIEGFLDILLPIRKSRARTSAHSKSSMSDTDPLPAPEHLPDTHQTHKLLFTVKPGGIAGYLGKYWALLSKLYI